MTLSRENDPEAVHVTGIGLISSLGDSFQDVSESLQAGRSGVVARPDWAELGLKSTVSGRVSEPSAHPRMRDIPKSLHATMGTGALHSACAALDALADSALEKNDVESSRTACLLGSSFGCADTILEAGSRIAAGRHKRVSPFTLVRSMTNTTMAGLVQLLQLQGPTYTVASACASSTQAIGQGAALVRAGVVDRALVGGCEELSDFITIAFGAMRMALSTSYNDRPAKASRPYDRNRDGFVISGGAAMLVLESGSELARRGARSYGRILGYGTSNDGHDVVHPDPTGAPLAACVEAALHDADLDRSRVSAVNTHGTSTPAGDLAEVAGLETVFGERLPPFSSTKSMGGHGLSAAGAFETIHCLAMLGGGFIAPSINVDEPDEGVADRPLVTECRPAELDVVLNTSLAFGGTNAALLIGR